MAIYVTTLLLTAAGLFRAALIVYGLWQDKSMKVKFTDIDYHVFTDAARFITEGQSPYLRDTYRYPPILAAALTPNIFLHHTWGKWLFSAADLLNGWLTIQILDLTGTGPQMTAFCAFVMLFNPFTATIATRGSCDALTLTLLLAMLYHLLWGRPIRGGLFYGAAVHLRIYPVIYALPLLVFLHHEHYPFLRKPSELTSVWQTAIVRFFVAAAAAFCALGGASYAFYGDEFVEHAYRYHWSRTDHRHNFAPEFYYEYLHIGRPAPDRSTRFFAKLPQGLSTFLFGMLNSRDPPWSFFLSTMAFVAFNPVITSQYFTWWMNWFPLVIPVRRRSSADSAHAERGREGMQPHPWLIVAILTWLGAQSYWLYWAYKLEFEGEDCFVRVWVASLGFFAASVWLLAQFAYSRGGKPFFTKGQFTHKVVQEEKKEKKDK